MRVAVSGAHGTGKSTLIAELAGALPAYRVVGELYYDLLDEGHAFGDPPSADDFELLLERSCAILETESATDIVYDRCPADYLGYLLAVRGGPIDEDLVAAAAALRRLDLIVFVPIERPDRIRVPASERPGLRRRVDAALRELLIEDAWRVGLRVLEVAGTSKERTQQVLGALA